MDFNPLPKAPTDNLYKFFSICGLVLFLMGGIVLAFGDDYLTYLEQRKAPRVEALRREHRLTKDDPKRTMEQRVDLSKRALEVSDLEATVDFYRRIRPRAQGAAWIAVLTGALLSGVGFYNWYVRHQRNLDRLAKPVPQSLVHLPKQ